MADMPNITMDAASLELLVTQILTKVNERIAGRIVTSISDASDDSHVPSALAVFNFLRTFSPGLKYETVTGSLPETGEASTIYLQRDNEQDETWVMYLMIDNAWISIGDTTMDLTNYWSKSDADILALKNNILDTTGINLIKTGISYDQLFQDNTATKEIILDWIGYGDLVKITEDGITELLTELDKHYVRKDGLETILDPVYVRKDAVTVVTEEQITSAVNNAFANTEPNI